MQQLLPQEIIVICDMNGGPERCVCDMNGGKVALAIGIWMPHNAKKN